MLHVSIRHYLCLSVFDKLMYSSAWLHSAILRQQLVLNLQNSSISAPYGKFCTGAQVRSKFCVCKIAESWHPYFIQPENQRNLNTTVAMNYLCSWPAISFWITRQQGNMHQHIRWICQSQYHLIWLQCTISNNLSPKTVKSATTNNFPEKRDHNHNWR